MPIPYMGSKRKSASEIVNVIEAYSKQDKKIFVDLFTGGFSIGEKFLKKGYHVLANDKNKYVIALLKKTILEGLDEKEVTKFITRERFNDVLNNCGSYEDWYVGYVMCVWSFGNNNQKGYLFGKDVEPYKKAGHELVINKNQDLIKQLIPNIPQKYIDGILSLSDWHKRRIALRQVTRKLKTRIFELQQLEQLERLERLELYSEDYRDVVIPEGAIIYCDPPYESTAEYAVGSFNHKEFWEWVRQTSKTNKVYVSEYKAPEDFKIIYEFSRKSTLQGGNQKHNNQPNECIFLLNEYA